jgi:hypothetical protein
VYSHLLFPDPTKVVDNPASTGYRQAAMLAVVGASYATLLLGALVFVWAEMTHAVAISFTIIIGAILGALSSIHGHPIPRIMGAEGV